MKSVKIIGALILIIAITACVFPQFCTCESQGKAITLADGKTVPMKCKWTAAAEIVVAVPLITVGLMMVASRRRDVHNLAIMGTILGIFMMLIPTGLIGVCQSSMICNTLMKPALVGLGSVTVFASLVGLLISLRNRDRA